MLAWTFLTTGSVLSYGRLHLSDQVYGCGNDGVRDGFDGRVARRRRGVSRNRVPGHDQNVTQGRKHIVPTMEAEALNVEAPDRGGKRTNDAKVHPGRQRTPRAVKKQDTLAANQMSEIAAVSGAGLRKMQLPVPRSLFMRR
jgi:hypothetical protein